MQRGSHAISVYMHAYGFHPLYVEASNATAGDRRWLGLLQGFHPLYVGASNATYAFVTYRIATI